MTNQYQKVIRFIDLHGAITPMDAYSYLGITKLATRVSEMRKKGLEFKIEYVTEKNRDGKPVRFAKYSFAEGNSYADYMQRL